MGFITTFDLTFTLIAIIILYIIYRLAPVLLRMRKVFEYGYKFPGPKAIPLLGNSLLLKNGSSFSLTLLKIMMDYGETPFRLWLGMGLAVCVGNPRDAQIVLNKALQKPFAYNFLVPVFGRGLITAPVPLWKKHRKMMNPAFNTKVLKTFLSVFHKHSQILVEELRSVADGREIELYKIVSENSNELAWEIAMGTALNMYGTDRLGYAWKRATDIGIQRTYQFWLHPDWIFWRTKLGKEFAECCKTIRHAVGIVIQDKFTDHMMYKKCDYIDKNDSIKNEINGNEGTNQRSSFLDLLLELKDADGEKLSIQQLVDESNTILIGGSDTSAVTISYVLVMLGIHRDIQDQVYAEICELFDNKDRPPSLEDLSKMKLLDRVVKETLRLFPVACFIAREATEDIQLEKNIVPAGATCILSIYGIHRSPTLWKNPEKFDPDRFKPENGVGRHPYSYLPFSGGPRNCIGMKFALISILFVVATVLKNYEVTCDYKLEDIEYKISVMMTPIKGFNARLTQRKPD